MESGGEGPCEQAEGTNLGIGGHSRCALGVQVRQCYQIYVLKCGIGDRRTI